jgi:hypothetical protein
VIEVSKRRLQRAKDQDREQAYDGLVADLRVYAGVVG